MKRMMLYLAAATAIFTTACKKEKIDPTKPSIDWTANAGFAQVEMTNALDAVVTVNAPGKFQDMKLVLNLGAYNILANQYVKIETNKSKSGSNPVLDLVADDSSVNLLGGLGMRVGSSLKDRDQLQLDLKKILERILLGQVVENNTSFSIELRVTDQAGGTAAKTAKFHFTAAPDITWDKNSSFGEVALDPSNKIDCKVKVLAPGKIEKLTVELKKDSDPWLVSYVQDRTSDHGTVIDLITETGVSQKFEGFPDGKAVSGKDQAILDFSFLYGLSYSMNPSLNVFTLTVVDQNGKETVVQLKFRKS